MEIGLGWSRPIPAIAQIPCPASALADSVELGKLHVWRLLCVFAEQL